MSAVLRVDGRRVVVSTHAVHRWRARVDRCATRAQMEARIVAEGRLLLSKPGWVQDHDGNAWAWLSVGAQIVLPLRVPAEASRCGEAAEAAEFVAATVLTKRRLCKQDVRWRREQAREDAQAA